MQELQKQKVGNCSFKALHREGYPGVNSCVMKLFSWLQVSDIFEPQQTMI